MILQKKLFRDIREQKGIFFSLCFIIALGLCMYIAMYMTLGSLSHAIDRYYADSRFGDAFAQVTAINQSQAQRLAELNGIEQVTARLTKDVRVLFPDKEENIYLRLIAYDLQDTEALNLPYVFSGAPISQTKDQGVYLNPDFAQAHNLQTGDSLPVLINGQQQTLSILGTAQSPEYIYAVSGKSDIFPNPALFGVAIIPQEFMAQLFSTSGEANSLSFRLAQEVEFADIEVPLKKELEKYGLLEFVARKDQISHFMLDTEVSQLANMGQSIPFLMLFISSVILIITLRRRVEAQRGQIGIMLAFGYTRKEILWHYLSYGFVVGLVGGILGALLGLVILDSFVTLYQVYFSIPGFEATIFPVYLGIAFALSLLCSLGACAYGCKDIMKLQPAEAMRPPAPLLGRRVFLESLTWFWHTLTMSGRMAARNMVRTPFRSFISLGGVALVFALMAVVFSFNKVIDIMIIDQFQKVEVYDIKVSFTGYQPESQVAQELANFSGIHSVETLLEFPCQLRNKNRIEDTVTIGLAPDARLLNILDTQGNYIHPSGEGLILSQVLADKLEVKSGSLLYLDAPGLKDPLPVVVQNVVPQYLGSNAYMEKTALWDLLGQGKIVSSAMLLAPPEVVSAFKSEYRLAESIQSINRPDEMFVMVTDYMDSYVMMIYLMGLAVSFVGFVIVYNSAMIAFSERSRELASLLVLGMYDHEVTEVISFEQWILSGIGMLLGIPMTYLFNAALTASFANDVYSMPMVVPWDSLLLAFGATCLYLFIAQMRVKKRVQTLQIVDVLKERE